jgi:predicted amidophosphoribosyltransferase
MTLLEASQVENRHYKEIDSIEFSEFLRSGPSRPILDRLLRIASEITGVEIISLAIRNRNKCRFISTFGIPFDSYFDEIPSTRDNDGIFESKFEILDLKESNIDFGMDKIPITFDFRYCANIPIDAGINLSDDGALALSAASLRPGERKNDTLSKLSRIAALITDSIWLMIQVQGFSSPKQKVAITANVLLEGLRQSHAPIAIVGPDGKIIEFSPGYANYQKAFVNSAAEPLQSVAEIWMDIDTQAKFSRALKDEQNLLNCVAYPSASDRPVMFDFFTLSFPQSELRVGVFSIHMKCLDPDWLPPANFCEEKSTYQAAMGESDSVVGEFLFKTLQERQKFSQRGGQNFITIRAWRKSIKVHQIAALRALKRDVSSAFAKTIADEMAVAVRKIYGDAVLGAVTAVPCGHSGPGCLAEKIAIALSANLGVPYRAAFECMELQGSSHPKTNARRPRMILVEKFDCPVVLVDDVVTSGAHLEEAAKKLKEFAPAVWPIAWVSD